LRVNKVELLTKEELESRLRVCLERREMPDCFLYLGDSGVRSWLSLSASAEFPIASDLTTLLVESLPALLPRLPARFSLVSVGVGDGAKERTLLEALSPRRVQRYCAVDVSSEMVDRALNAVAHIEVEKCGIVAFLEDLPSLRRFWSTPALLCLLGNNFCNYDPAFILEMLRGQLGADDLFLFDCHLLPPGADGRDGLSQRVEETYRSGLNALFNINPLVQRGLSPDDCVFHLDLVPVQGELGTVYRTSKCLEIANDARIALGSGELCLSAGDRIRLGFTYKYTRGQLHEYLVRHGFSERELFQSCGGDNVLVLVGRERA